MYNAYNVSSIEEKGSKNKDVKYNTDSLRLLVIRNRTSMIQSLDRREEGQRR